MKGDFSYSCQVAKLKASSLLSLDSVVVNLLKSLNLLTDLFGQHTCDQ